MLANFLNKSKPINFIGLMIFFVICYLTLQLVQFFNNQLQGNIFFERIIILFVFLIIFFIFNFIVSKNNFTYDNSFSFYFFSVLMFSFSESANYTTLFLSIIYLLFLRKIYSLQSSKAILKKLFDAGFWVGILCVFEPKFTLFFLLIYLGAYWYQKITIHTFLTPIIGFITPLFCYFSYLFWFDKQAIFNVIFSKEITFKMSFFTDEKEKYFLIGLLIATFFALIFKSNKVLLINNTFKKSWSLLLMNLLIVFSLFLFENESKSTEMLFLLFPISLILANGVELIQKRIFLNIFLYLFLIGCLAFQFFL
jgi:hypothetical protein